MLCLTSPTLNYTQYESIYTKNCCALCHFLLVFVEDRQIHEHDHDEHPVYYTVYWVMQLNINTVMECNTIFVALHMAFCFVVVGISSRPPPFT